MGGGGESLSDACPLSELNNNREREREGGRIKERRNCGTEDLHANRQACAFFFSFLFILFYLFGVYLRC